MTRRGRLALFAVAMTGFPALLVWGTSGIPDFGHYQGRYGKILEKAPVTERQATNAGTAIVFDYRGLDTLGEEFTLSAAVSGASLSLRESREKMPEHTEKGRTDAVRAVGTSLAVCVFLLAI